MLRGRSPRDPKNKNTLLQAFAQGGGDGIYGDFLIKIGRASCRERVMIWGEGGSY